ncbi:ABC-three component system protein [Rhizobium hidalgonense]|uniref:ABC-three component system protein n=1 Tax=Rhizobium hidalgonense TaxID=1538159 RepID=UPI00110652C9|nr:ABC-three component system protein [Rhizobium hidalgonense]QKK27035.1 hypothetical protein FFM81_027685 [Rhizobium hidalgonense]
MTAQELIADALIPGTHSVLVLGSFERRVTVYSQQVRALNLVDAIIQRGLARPTGQVAIIGGGVAGITAAVALSKVIPNAKAIDLFEAQPNVLSLQRNSQRYLHPHFYDWPSAGSENEGAGLPIMNWTAGPAGQIAEVLKAQFEEATRNSILNLLSGRRVRQIKPSSLAGARVIVEGDTSIGRIYDVVILAIGFGLEAHIAMETLSYWTPSPLAGAINTNVANPLLFISGNGDGGLVDFIMAAFDALEHQAICEFLMSLNLGPALDELRAIEDEAWAEDANMDILAEYRARLTPLIPHAVWSEVRDRLRAHVAIYVHTNEPFLLRRTTALHNRLAVYLILHVDAAEGRNAITVKTGVGFVDGVVPTAGPVALVGEAGFTPFRRFLRLGTDTAPNLGPFEDILGTYPVDHALPLSGQRPASPVLTASALARFQELAQTPPVAALAAVPQPPPAQNQNGLIEICISHAPGGQVRWSGNCLPGDAQRPWTELMALSLHCAIGPFDAGDLVKALARLAAHTLHCIIYADDTNSWSGALKAVSSGRELPGPDLDVNFTILEKPVITAHAHEVTVSTHELASIIHARLDLATFDQLSAALHDCLGPGGGEMGWPIEGELRAKLLQRWFEWQPILMGNPVTLRRFLSLLATERDPMHLHNQTIVNLGPKTIRPFLLKAAIFALTFAVCSGHSLTPATVHPGNVVTQSITAHACGVGWIDGKDLGSKGVSARAWTTGLVLLSQLKAAFQLLQPEGRFDSFGGSTVRIGTVSPAEQPLLIGADEEFLEALEGGELATQSYFESVFRWRAETTKVNLE